MQHFNRGLLEARTRREAFFQPFGGNDRNWIFQNLEFSEKFLEFSEKFLELNRKTLEFREKCLIFDFEKLYLFEEK